MNLKATLLDFYFKVENVYYAAIDKINSKIPVYKYFVNPLEEKGIPSLPVAAAMLFLLFGGLLFLMFAGPNGLKVTIVESRGQAIEGAYVSLLDADGFEVFNELTDANGIASFKTLKNVRTIVVSAEGFVELKKPIEPGTFTLKMRTEKEQKELNIAIAQNSSKTSLSAAQKANFSDVLQFLATPQGIATVVMPEIYSSVIVNVTDENGLLVSGAIVSIYDAHSNALLKTATATNGKALIDGLKVNSEVYATANKAQYQLVNRTQFYVVNTQGEVNVKLTQLILNGPNANAHYTNFTVASQGEQVSGASINIYTFDGTLINTTSTDRRGNASIILLNKQYYAVIEANGYLTFVTEDFQSGAKIQAELLDSLLGVTLKVNAIDFNLNPIKASFGIFNERNRFIQAIDKNETSVTFFKLYPNVTITSKASSGTQTGTGAIKLENKTNELTIQLDAHYSTVIVSVIDLLTNVEIPTTATVYLGEVAFANCTGVNCSLKVRALPNQILNVSNEAYFSQLVPLETPLADQNSVVYVRMLSIASVSDSAMILNNIYDYATMQPVQQIKSGRLYFADFTGVFVNSEVNKMYFSPTEPLDAKVRILNFTPTPTSGANIVIEGYKNGCTPRAFEQLSDYVTEQGYADTFGRIAMTTFGSTVNGAPSSYTYFFAVNPSHAPLNLNLTWHSLITRGADTIRNPFDAQRQSNAASVELPECESTSIQKQVDVTSPNSEHTEFGDLHITLAQNKIVAQDIQNPLEDRTECGEGDFNFQTFGQFDCNGFSVDSGSPNEFYFNFSYTNLNVSVNSPITLTITASNENFELQKFTYSFDQLVEKTLDGAQLPEVKVEHIENDRGNRLNLKGSLALKAIKTTDFTNLKVSLQTERGIIEKEVYVNIKGFNLNPDGENPENAVLFKEFNCGFTNSLTFNYDPSLIPLRGTGWIGCSQLPLVVDPIFPADAIKIYVQKRPTVQTLDVQQLEEINDYQIDFQFNSIDGDASKISNCYYSGLVAPKIDRGEITQAEIDAHQDYSIYLIKYNAANENCKEITGNEINPTNATLIITRREVTAGGLPDDSINVSINVTINKKISDVFNTNLELRPIIKDQTIVGVSKTNRVEIWSTLKTPQGYSDACPATTTKYYLFGSDSNVYFIGEVIPEAQVANYLNTYNLPSTQLAWELSLKENFNKIKTIYTNSLALNANNQRSGNLIITKRTTFADGILEPYAKTLTAKNAFAQDKKNTILVKEGTHYFERSWANTAPYFVCIKKTSEAFSKTKYQADLLALIGTKAYSTTPIDPQVYYAINNAQFKRDLKYEISKIAPPVEPNGELIPLENPNAIAIGVSTKLGDQSASFSLLENSNLVSQESFLEYSDLQQSNPVVNPSAKKYFELIEDANNALNASALRRSSNITYYCNQAQNDCRPNLNAWVKIVETPVEITQACIECNANICNSDCNPETRINSTGGACFNACAPPICESSDICKQGVKTTQLNGRKSLVWENTTNLIKIEKEFPELYEPLKYFLNELNENKFTLSTVVNADKCLDTLSNLENNNYDGSCFYGPQTSQVWTQSRHPAELSPSDYQSGTPLSNIKLTEAQGGCEPSTEWPRGFYKVQFKFGQEAEQLWRWRISTEPLRVESYVQNKDDFNSCTLDPRPAPRLCYYIYSSNSPASNYPGGIGNCVASLRESIKESEVDNQITNQQTSYRIDYFKNHYFNLDFLYAVSSDSIKYDDTDVLTRNMRLISDKQRLCNVPNTIEINDNYDAHGGIIDSVGQDIFGVKDTETTWGNGADNEESRLWRSFGFTGPTQRRGLTLALGGFAVDPYGKLDWISSMLETGRKTCKDLYITGHGEEIDEDDSSDCVMEIYAKIFDAYGKQQNAPEFLCLTHTVVIK